MTYIIQISDTHLFGDKNATINGFNSYMNLKLVMEYISGMKEKPELIAITGDLSQDCTLESYYHLNAFLDKLGIKFCLLPGNHDDISVLNRSFDLKWSKESSDYSVDVGNWLLYFLDSSIYPEAHGDISDSQMKKLEDTLKKSQNKSVVVFMHHHPIKTESWIDSMILDKAEKFTSFVDKNKQIKAVLFGHIHQQFEKNINGTFYASVPSTSYQIKPGTDSFALDKLTPGFRMVELNGTTFKSDVVRVSLPPTKYPI